MNFIIWHKKYEYKISLYKNFFKYASKDIIKFRKKNINAVY